MEDFAVFILTHARPDKVITYDTLIKEGYTGKIYIIIDNEDKTAERYYKRFGDKVIMFNKFEKINETDLIDNFDDYRIVIFARNKCHDIARELGLKYFLVLDDDYSQFGYRINENM